MAEATGQEVFLVRVKDSSRSILAEIDPCRSPSRCGRRSSAGASSSTAAGEIEDSIESRFCQPSKSIAQFIPAPKPTSRTRSPSARGNLRLRTTRAIGIEARSVASSVEDDALHENAEVFASGPNPLGGSNAHIGSEEIHDFSARRSQALPGAVWRPVRATDTGNDRDDPLRRASMSAPSAIRIRAR